VQFLFGVVVGEHVLVVGEEPVVFYLEFLYEVELVVVPGQQGDEGSFYLGDVVTLA
jgi:hypothetical protein